MIAVIRILGYHNGILHRALEFERWQNPFDHYVNGADAHDVWTADIIRDTFETCEIVKVSCCDQRKPVESTLKRCRACLEPWHCDCVCYTCNAARSAIGKDVPIE